MNEKRQTERKELTEKALKAMLSYQDITKEYHQLQDVINKARARRIAITRIKDRLAEESKEAIQILKDKF